MSRKPFHPRDLGCPLCRVAPGSPCLTPSGRILAEDVHHTERIPGTEARRGAETNAEARSERAAKTATTGFTEPGLGVKDPRSVPCSHCGAAPGSPCMRPSGHAVFAGGFHSGREKAVASTASSTAATKAGDGTSPLAARGETGQYSLF